MLCGRTVPGGRCAPVAGGALPRRWRSSATHRPLARGAASALRSGLCSRAAARAPAWDQIAVVAAFAQKRAHAFAHDLRHARCGG